MAKNIVSNLPANVIQKLLMTKIQYQQDQPYDKVIIGVAIFHPTNGKICLLKRTADEIYYPNVFELPSGNVDSSDLPLMHALVREVKEEAIKEYDSVTGSRSYSRT